LLAARLDGKEPSVATRKLFIGVDIGTQGVKAAVFDRDGACFGEADG
jgi:sugar (pentulose or hexulose) kinase